MNTTNDNQERNPHHEELGKLLKHWREQLTPEQVGLTRKRPGRRKHLTQEEVAELVGIGDDVYRRIEQGRYPLTTCLLDRIIDVLKVSPDKAAYAFHLSGLLPQNRYLCTTQVSAEVQLLLDAYEPNPAYAMNGRWDIIGWNKMASTVFPMLVQWEDIPCAMRTGFEQNVVYFMLMDPLSRETILEWDGHMQRIVKEFRLTYGQYREDAYVCHLVEYLKEQSDLFRQWWNDPDVGGKTPTQKVVNHRVVGQLVLQQMASCPTHDPDVQLVFYTPLDAETEHKLSQLQEGRSLPIIPNLVHFPPRYKSVS